MRLKYKKISFESKEFIKILNLNLELFPPNELKAPINLADSTYANDGNLEIFAFYDDSEFVGYSAVYIYGEVCYLAFLAVSPKIQCCGYGSEILDILRLKFNKIVLEIESLDESASDLKQRIRRSKFYQKCGFNDSKRWIEYLGMRYSIYSNSAFKMSDFIEMFELFKRRNYFKFRYY